MIPSTSIPIVSALFFVVIGTLIGHLLWYRYEDEDPHSESEPGQQHDDDTDSTVVNAHHQNQTATDLEKSRTELAQLRKSYERLENQWHELKTEHDRLESKLTYSQHEYQEVNDQSLDQTSRITELESGLADAIRELENSRNNIDDAEQQRQRLEAMRLTLHQEVAELTNQIGEQSELSQVADQQLADLKQKAETLENEAIAWTEEKASLLAKMTAERDRRSAAEAKLLSAESRIAELRFEADQLKTASIDHDVSTALITNLRSRITQLTSERNEASHLASRHEDDLGELQEKLEAHVQTDSSLRQQIDQLKSSLQETQQERDAAIESSKTQQAQTHQLKKDSDDLLLLRESHLRLQQKLDEANHGFIRLTAEIEKSNANLGIAQERIAELNQVHSQQLDDAQNMNSRLEEELSVARNSERLLGMELDSLRMKLGSEFVSLEVVQKLESNLANERKHCLRNASEISEKDDELSHLRERITQLESEARETQQIRNELLQKTEYAKNVSIQLHEAVETEHSTREIVVELRNELNDRLEILETLQQEKDIACANLSREKQRNSELSHQLQSRAQISDQEIKRLSDRIADHEKTIRKTRRERNELKKQQERAGDRQFISLSSMKLQTTGTENYDEPSKVKYDDQLGAIYSKRPTQADDLKEITGIAAILERKLNKVGIYKFQQIMRWDDCVVEEAAKLLSLGDRIQRDNWTGQARRLYREHHVKKAA